MKRVTVTLVVLIGLTTASPYPQPGALAQTSNLGTGALSSAVDRVQGRLLTLDEAVAIALDYQPQIQARLADYAAARFRVSQALAPLLPQLSSQVTTTRSQNVALTTSINNVTSVVSFTRDFNDSLLAQVQLSQLL